MTRPNIVIVIFDTARRDRFGCYGYARPTTPVVDQLAREGQVFEHMITPGPWTLPSHGSLFTGLYPREHAVGWRFPVLGKDYRTIASHLAEYGYSTACVTANSLLSRSGLVEGFQITRARKFVQPGRLARRIRFLLGNQDHGSEGVVRYAGRLLESSLRPPFFLVVNFMETHWPYRAPRRFQKRLMRRRSSLRRATRWRMRYAWEAIAAATPEELAQVGELYDAALATVDERLGRLLDLLRRARYFDDTIVVVAADHGENIGDYGLAGHQGSLHGTLIHVPFIVRIPGRGAARIPGLVQFTDVFAGLCGLAGIEPPPALRDRPHAIDPFGSPAMNGGRAYAFSEWQHWGAEREAELQRHCPHFDFSRIPKGLEAVQDRRFKLVVRLDTGEETFFDLFTDSRETRNSAADHPGEVVRLRGALADWRVRFPEAPAQTYSAQEAEAVEAQLRALGYL